MSLSTTLRSALLLLIAAGGLWALLNSRPSETAPGVKLTAYPPGRVTVAARGSSFRVVDSRDAVMGTHFAVEVDAPDALVGRAAAEAAFLLIFRLEQTLSTWIPDSPLSRLNRQPAAKPMAVDGHTWELLQRAFDCWGRTDRAFDPTVGPLLALWRPLSRMAVPPTDQEIVAALSNVGFEMVRLEEGGQRVSFLRDGMSLDLGGIAKGYAADLAARAALDAGATACRVNAGGDMVGSGAPSWSPDGFEVAIRDPDAGPADSLPESSFHVRDRGVATSGNYERYTQVGEERYSHILDPRTGRPVPDAVVQVTVIAPDATTADALATALTVLGVERGLAVAEEWEGVEAFFVLSDPEEGYRATSGFPGGPR